MLKGWMQNYQTDQSGPLGMTEPTSPASNPVTVAKVIEHATITTTPMTTVTPTPITVTSIEDFLKNKQKDVAETVTMSNGMKILNPKKKSSLTPTPAKLNENPIQVEANPAKSNESPILVEANPVKLDESPIRVETNPVKSESPIQVETNPVKLNESPIEVATNPVKLNESPIEVATNSLVEKKKKVSFKGVFDASEIEGGGRLDRGKKVDNGLNLGNNKSGKIKKDSEGGRPKNMQQQQNDNPVFEYDCYFLSWLIDNHVSLFVSSYKAQRVISIGSFVDQRDKITKLSMWLTNFNRPMGLTATDKTIWVSASGNMWKFENTGELEDSRENIGKFDSNYVIRRGHFSSDIDNHDICTDTNGQVYYCSAAFSCICTTSDDKSFKVFWKPPWISKIVPEDRCHLNGVCSRDGVPRYVTSVSQSNVRGGWRENRIGKGIIYDIVENKIVCDGLTMPHSPRWYNGKLYVLDAGTGYFGYVGDDGKFVRKVWLPGYLRGMSFVNNRYVVVGTSEDRHENVFKGLPLGEELTKNDVTAKCGIHVIDMTDFSIPHNLIFTGGPDNELYDVIAVKGIRRPKLSEINESSNMTNYNIDFGIYTDVNN